MDHYGLLLLVHLVEDQMAFDDQDAIALLFQGGVAWHDMFLAEIVGVSVSPDLLSKEGRLNMELAHLPVFMHGAYYGVGKKIAKIGCSTDKPKKKGKTK